MFKSIKMIFVSWKRFFAFKTSFVKAKHNVGDLKQKVTYQNDNLSSFEDYIKDDKTILEGEPLENLSKEKKLFAYKHEGFSQCMDTKRDKDLLENYIKKGNAPWI